MTVLQFIIVITILQVCVDSLLENDGLVLFSNVVLHHVGSLMENCANTILPVSMQEKLIYQWHARPYLFLSELWMEFLIWLSSLLNYK